MRLELSGEHNDEEFEAFHQRFLEALLATFDLYWVYVEGTKQPKRKIRSHTKLFYEWRKNGQLEADQGLIEDGRFVRLSHLGLMEALLHPDAFLYSYLYDGKDDLVFTAYCGKAIYNRFRQLLIAHLPNEGELVEAAPNASDTEDLVRLYFKDWRS